MRSTDLAALLLAGTAFLAAGCSDGESLSPLPKPAASAPPAPLPGPSAWNRAVTPPDDTEAVEKRAACAYHAGDLPAETQGASYPNGSAIPIDHIVLLMQENRSFDHYFQKLPEYGQPDVEVAPEGYTNPDPEGQPVAPFHDTPSCFVDTNHDWAGSHQQVDGGKMDGFYTTNEGWSEMPLNGTLAMMSGKRALSYYDGDDLPFYYALASQYAIADHYHCSLLGPTWPNRMYFYAASSFGLTDNVFPTAPNTLPDYLEERQIDWKIYNSGGVPGFGLFLDQFLKYRATHLFPIEQFYADAAAGKLPQVALVDPLLGEEDYNRNDEHPPAVATIGQAFVASVVDALTKSPNWPRSAMFITYDEHGGLWDHVVPPPACPPDDIAPILKPTDPVAGFDQLGMRVPMMLVSPFAKEHYVAHHVYDHTSIVRFVEARFVMPALSNRDANAEAPWEMFDFERAPHAVPPWLPTPPVNDATVDVCKRIYVN
jgi:phospholipase C